MNTRMQTNDRFYAYLWKKHAMRQIQIIVSDMLIDIMY